MAVDPLTAKILAKVAMQAATDSESRKRILFMILAPVLLLMLRNLWRAGMFHATVRDLTMAARDMAAILHGKPEETDPPEPEKPGETVQKMEKES